MKEVTLEDIKNLYIPPADSHKGQNGRLIIIGGSHLFHAASLWALTVASRIVDLTHYSSVPENNEIVAKLKSEFRNGIIVPRSDIDAYIEEDDAILIGPGMTRDSETEELTNKFLKKYPHKQWILDAGALQMVDVSLLPKKVILTPHHQEFESLYMKATSTKRLVTGTSIKLEDKIKSFAKEFNAIVLVKGSTDCVSNRGEETVEIRGGNAGMTKGGTGDVLAGLIAAIATKNDPYLATIAGSFINKAAGDSLFKKVGLYFNASDLANEIPVVMKKLLAAQS